MVGGGEKLTPRLVKSDSVSFNHGNGFRKYQKTAAHDYFIPPDGCGVFERALRSRQMSVQRVYNRSFDEDDGKTINKETCSECGGVLRTAGGETTCEKCGLIVDEYWIDHAVTARDYQGDETNTEQTGSPLTPARHDRGLSTEIGRYRDGRGNELPESTRRTFSRLRRYHGRAQYRTKAERNLMDAFTEIARLASALELPFSIRERACTYFRVAQRENLVRGRLIDAIAAASVYAACRCTDCTRTLSEVAAIAGCTLQALRNRYRLLNAELELKADPPRPTEFVSRIASECDVLDSVRYRAYQLANRAAAQGLSSGRQPSSVAATCVYIASQETGGLLTQSEIAAVADTTTQTIRTRYREPEAELT